MFDGEVESEEEFETTVTTSIQKALSALWNTHKFPFRYKTYTVKTKSDKSFYNTPNGNIVSRVVNGVTKPSVICNSTFLEYDNSIDTYEEKSGEPTSFCIKNDNLYLYPTPDDVYTIKIDYLTMECAIDGDDGSSKSMLENDDDYIDIPDKYESVFKNTLMPLAMVYLIASETDENYSAYYSQYKTALDILLEYAEGIEKDKTIGWR